MVGLIDLCANPNSTGVAPGALEHLATKVPSDSTVGIEAFPVSIRDINRRLGVDAVQQLVRDYASGTPTTQLTKKYGIGKSSVLRLPADNNVAMRRQGVSTEQAAAARTLYEGEDSLAQVAWKVGVPKQSVRLALLQLGVEMRPSGSQLKRPHEC